MRPARAATTFVVGIGLRVVLPLVGTNFCVRPSGAPREAV